MATRDYDMAQVRNDMIDACSEVELSVGPIGTRKKTVKRQYNLALTIYEDSRLALRLHHNKSKFMADMAVPVTVKICLSKGAGTMIIVQPRGTSGMEVHKFKADLVREVNGFCEQSATSLEEQLQYMMEDILKALNSQPNPELAAGMQRISKLMAPA